MKTRKGYSTEEGDHRQNLQAETGNPLPIFPSNLCNANNSSPFASLGLGLALSFPPPYSTISFARPSRTEKRRCAAWTLLALHSSA